MSIQTMKRRGIETLAVAVVMVIASNGCAEPDGKDMGDSGPKDERDAGRHPSQAERDAWELWTSGFVQAVCGRNAACKGNPVGGGPCYESGDQAAEMALCDEAVMFYIANRKALDECISKYPTDCSVTAAEACPLITGDKEFETICK